MHSGKPLPTINVLACQIEVPVTLTTAARDQHLQSMAARVGSALEQHRQSQPDNPVRLVVLPELSSIDYSRESFEQLQHLAEDLHGPSTDCWRKIATQHNAFIAYSFPRKSDKHYTISVAIIDPTGTVVGVYDKLHLAQYGASMEKEYFQRGENLLVFEIDGLRVAPIICYDIRFPELCRSLAVEHRVDLILHCGAYYRDESFYTWHDFVRTRALENQLHFLSLNRAGKHYGNSLYCPPWVDNEISATHFDEHREDFKTLLIDRTRIEQVREQYAFLHDRLDSY
jgi:nitrilase